MALLSLAQKKLYYCEVKGIEKELTSGLKIVFDFGEKTSYNKTTIPDLARKTGLSARKISNELKALREDFHILKREGGRKDGYWIIDEFQV